jgi:hypothetical protein
MTLTITGEAGLETAMQELRKLHISVTGTVQCNALDQLASLY